MTLLELVSAVAGTGILSVGVTQLVAYRKAALQIAAKKDVTIDKAERDDTASIRTDLRRMLQDERRVLQDERTALLNERKNHQDCREMVSQVKIELETVRGLHAECPGKMQSLQAEVKQIRDTLLESYINRGSER